mmetsp:Transcript_21388/g.38932  ORF Transcript_21388/g.38932 Transcript_21388/m.38932 type:complete len:210 (+) Transcript_21388:1099-1728(+)
MRAAWLAAPSCPAATMYASPMVSTLNTPNCAVNPSKMRNTWSSKRTTPAVGSAAAIEVHPTMSLNKMLTALWDSDMVFSPATSRSTMCGGIISCNRARYFLCSASTSCSRFDSRHAFTLPSSSCALYGAVSQSQQPCCDPSAHIAAAAARAVHTLSPPTKATELLLLLMPDGCDEPQSKLPPSKEKFVLLLARAMVFGMVWLLVRVSLV